MTNNRLKREETVTKKQSSLKKPVLSPINKHEGISLDLHLLYKNLMFRVQIHKQQ